MDVPLRTNLEMVQILKRLNNTVNTLVEPYPHDRLRTRRVGLIVCELNRTMEQVVKIAQLR